MSNKLIRTIKREIFFSDSDYDKQVKQYLFDNMWYRRQCYKHGIEYLRKLDEINAGKAKEDRIYFDKYAWDTMYHREVESKMDGSDGNKPYSYYISGIRATVSDDLRQCNVMMWKSRNAGVKANPKNKYRRYHQSFGIYNKYTNHTYTRRRLRIVDDLGYVLELACTGSRWHPLRINFNLKESIFSDDRYVFGELDILTIHFLYKNGKFYILLQAEVTVSNIKYDPPKHPLAGIDLGERNSVTLHNGEKCDFIDVIDFLDPPRNRKKTRQRIDRLNARIDALQNHLSNKEYGSRSYYKTLLHMNKLYERIHNIIKDRRRKLAFHISKQYEHIIVDEFTVPIITKGDGIAGQGKKIINKDIQIHCMGYFKQDLRVACEKYKCWHYEAKPYTTRICSVCGHVNEALTLKETHLKCSNCGARVHRDMNAAINCYNQYDDLGIVWIRLGI